MSNTLTDVQPSRLIELPVAEEMQMGMSLAGSGWQSSNIYFSALEFLIMCN